MQDLNGMFMHFLQDMYYAERQVLKALPKLAKAAQNPELKDMFTKSREEKPQHVETMQNVFELVGKRARGVTCEAINGLIEEAEELLEENPEPSPARDAGLIACAQAMAHYGMARYGTLAAWAGAIGQQEAGEVLRQMLDANKSADGHLSELALQTLNPQAAESDGDDEADEEEEEAPKKPARAAAKRPAKSPAKPAAKPAPKAPAKRRAKAKSA